ncbi:DTX3L [Branchiostoma lanceolatum]|uniref:E3 ubiquitin-protein ligase n=1 Tax=Branchiostoma lanceolatum TaxID=7740 RepID=A0A8J9ZBQ7_BRALA|nr:DTX3L [Branchiostoma lanceolatum]
MGVIVSKHKNRKQIAGSIPTTMSRSDQKDKSKHGSAKKASRLKQPKEKDDMSLQGARVTVEEKGTDGKYDEDNSVLITEFDGSVEELKQHFKRKYSTDFKQAIEVWGDIVVEFKSRQVAEMVTKTSHKVGKKSLRITPVSTSMKKDEKKVAKRHKDKDKDVETTPAAEKKGHIYPVDELKAMKDASHKGDRPSSKDKSKRSVPKPESKSDGPISMSSELSKAKVLTGMENYVSDEEEESKNDAQGAKVADKSTKTTDTDQNGHVTNASVNEMDIELDAVKVEFIKKVHGKELDDICRTNNVDVVEQKNESQSCRVIFRAKIAGKGKVESACDQFEDLYGRISSKLSRNNTIHVLEELPDCTIRSLKNALAHAEADDRILVKNCLSDDFKVVFYGSKDDVADAIETFIKNSGHQENARYSEKTTDPQPPVPHAQTMDTLDYVGFTPSNDIQFEGTVNNITVRVYEGDLTQETVDAVVNAANKRLEHAGGVALAISEAGGKKIQKESSDYVRKHGPLAIGQAMHTGAGKMFCRYVIHTVGPKWKSHGDEETVKVQLNEAMFNVLHYASNHLKAASIAIPAISSGIFGVPVDICAEQLMLATQKFVQSPPGNNTLRDIRFVNIDGQINRTFVRVFSDSLPSNNSSAHQSEVISDEDCPICMDKVEKPKRLRCCNNVFCTDCIDKAFQVKPVCPTCGYQSGVLKGTQPRSATMAVATTPRTLPGYHGCGTIQINYDVPDGFQEACHPNPGRPYKGTRRMAFLPDNREGREVLQLLRRAFDSRLVFTVGTSVTTGETDVVIWNDIHHKTSPYDGPSNYGYPDPGYLRRVTDELAAKGIR